MKQNPVKGNIFPRETFHFHVIFFIPMYIVWTIQNVCKLLPSMQYLTLTVVNNRFTMTTCHLVFIQSVFLPFNIAMSIPLWVSCSPPPRTVTTCGDSNVTGNICNWWSIFLCFHIIRVIIFGRFVDKRTWKFWLKIERICSICKCIHKSRWIILMICFFYQIRLHKNFKQT